MKTLILTILACTALSSCVTSVTKNADGSTTTTKRVDADGLRAGTQAALTAAEFAERFSGK